MSKFIQHTGIVVPIDVSNVDTDVIIPKQFLQKITKKGFGKHLFNDWRYVDEKGTILNRKFILNNDIYKNGTILLARENFGCGSSREHAVWALVDYGFKTIIATSFSDIFYSNSLKNSLLPITLSKETIDILFQEVYKNMGMFISVNLLNNKIFVREKQYSFKINSFNKYCLMHGLDDIDLTLKYSSKILNYETLIPEFLKK
ncbi:3-isopropylmalate dehydratase small subunit [Buchnera aphidicola str. Bp (Baizongia pistaciae)]|uniref:3-isopropylmalate dehydratase small subunit n=1 Tax=Buchnera aphidicola subsp. Baizongia pistaciae (strain Bp) TaxID=224915 RepID=LEUD_BUCBP|nr:3-isopropylmalate dehydratase small subunit [Buchnera aphidicola]P59516.1 RecName: Full=3-isopropylmalate dehydratase small subunit; AltName: Full=Alpha-IPM isomerase; Short=IPMI; AltName: Full=Isopropylmalate isomerase [Buchnera aphidicola str. Bp (Baizongia pistaciae)]AAO27199.1 3-isopropylmalate dehydratase small subunit [Buchnera aphidicola str. Bp (Baizongia pistaciae)]